MQLLLFKMKTSWRFLDTAQMEFQKSYSPRLKHDFLNLVSHEI